MRKLNTLVPSEMSKEELLSVCGALQTAKNWNQSEVSFTMMDGTEQIVSVAEISSFRQAFSPITGQTKV